MQARLIMSAVLIAALAYSFWSSAGWLQLCAGLALFLFGMQCLEEGLRQLAGGKLEQLLGRSTATPFKGLLFGTAGTMLLQSSTLVSLLTIAFISSGLIQLAGGIAILLGANLGATSGIWLLAMAGQNLSLSPLALPLVVFGVLGSFTGPKGKAAGRIVLGIAFIFLAIDQIKEGFTAFGGDLDMTAYQIDGLTGQLLFILVGLFATVVLQSSHATLMLTLAALASGQLGLEQSLALAIGANVGSSLSTAIVGALGGNRSGQQLALAHVVFNVLTATLALILLSPLTWLVLTLTEQVGLGSNNLIQLALFHTLFNAGGVLLFWPWQKKLAQLLQRWLPEAQEPVVLISEQPDQPERTQSRYLHEQALDSVEAASSAVVLELRHLSRLSQEVICHALYLPVSQLTQAPLDDRLLQASPSGQELDAETLYQRYIKGVYSEILSFMGRMELPLDEEHRRFWLSCQLTALQLVDAVKDAKHLQKNLGNSLRQPPSAVRDLYVELRRHLLVSMRELFDLGARDMTSEVRGAYLQRLDEEAAAFDSHFRERLFVSVRNGRLSGLQMSSLMNDLGYVGRIFQSLRNVMQLAEEQGLLQSWQPAEGFEGPLINVH